MDKHVSQSITQWFHRRVEGVSPAMAVREIMDRFFAAMKRRKHNLVFNEKQVRLSICEAVCTMRLAHLNDNQWNGPYRTFPSPAGWNNAYDALWDDWVRSRCYNYEFWESFWNRIPEEAWESSIPYIRNSIEYLLPLYVSPDIQSLIKDNLICNEEDDAEARDDGAVHYDMYY
jgi:hypothetical protein